MTKNLMGKVSLKSKTKALKKMKDRPHPSMFKIRHSGARQTPEERGESMSDFERGN